MNTRKTLLILLAVYILGSIGITGYYWYQDANYVQSDDGRVKVDLTVVRSPAAGRLVELSVNQNEMVAKGAVIALLESSPGPNQNRTRIPILAPVHGQILRASAHANESLAQGEALMAIADLEATYVEIRVPEDKADHARAGQQAEIRLDADNGRSVTGVVAQVGGYTETAVWPIVPLAPGRQQQKEEQLVPIKIMVPGVSLVPGTGASVKIRVGEGLYGLH